MISRRSLAPAAVFLFLFSSLLSATETVFITDPKTGKRIEVIKDHILVKYKSGISAARRKALQFAPGSTSLQYMPNLQTEAIQISSGSDLLSNLEYYRNQPEIQFAEFDPVRYPLAQPNDPGISLQKGHTPIELYKAWDKLSGASPVKVAVLDWGFDYTHEDLGQQFACSTCPIYDGFDFGNNDADPINDSVSVSANSHGTSVAGIIAANTNNAVGIAGISNNLANILAVKVSNTAGVSVGYMAGLSYALQKRVRVVNLSLGQENPSQIEQSAIDALLAAGIIVVASAGNCGDPSTYQLNHCTTLNPTHYPAAYPGVIAVGAVNPDDTLCSFSNTGSYVTLVAPGSQDYSTYPGGNLYAPFSGTSMSAPYVTGVVALLLANNPFLTASQVKSILISSVDDLGPAGFDTTFGYGRLNAFKAMTALSPTPPPEDVTVPMPNPFLAGAGGQVTFRVPLQMGGTAVGTKIFDALGRHVRTVSGNQWDGKNENGHAVASGVYFYELETTAGKSRNKFFVIR